MEARDEYNATLESAFTVTLLDEMEPLRPSKIIPISTGLEMIWVEPGTFSMGQEGVAESVHEVTITKGFYMGKYEITQNQYMDLIGLNPSEMIGNERPVEKVSWTNAKWFCFKLTESERYAGISDKFIFDLPTEAEEYVYRQDHKLFTHGATHLICLRNNANWILLWDQNC